MSVLRSRAELAKEPRTMYFLMEKTPLGNSHPSLPFMLEVFVPAEARSDYRECSDCAGVYQVTESSALALIKKAGIPKPPKGNRIYVCEHMGRLIE